MALTALGVPGRAYAVPAPSGGDDSAALQGAIDAAQPGDTLQLSEGVYTVDDTLMLDTDDIWLIGAASGLTVVRAGTALLAANAPVLSVGSAIDLVVIADLIVVSSCGTDETRAGEAGIELDNVTLVAIQDCQFRDSSLNLVAEVEGLVLIRTV